MDRNIVVVNCRRNGKDLNDQAMDRQRLKKIDMEVDFENHEKKELTWIG